MLKFTLAVIALLANGRSLNNDDERIEIKLVKMNALDAERHNHDALRLLQAENESEEKSEDEKKDELKDEKAKAKVTKKEIPVTEEAKIEASKKEPKAKEEEVKATKAETETVNEEDKSVKPAAKVKDTPAAKGKDTPAAEGKDTPAAEGKETPAAEVQETPASEVKEAPAAEGKAPEGSKTIDESHAFDKKYSSAFTHQRQFNTELLDGHNEGIYIDNFGNEQYYAQFLFGSRKQPLMMMLDTGSSLSWISSDICQSCYGNLFHTKLSDSYTNLTAHKAVQYGEAKVEGYLSNDVIEIQQKGDIEPKGQMNFLAVRSSKNFPILEGDGLVGLSPRVPNENSKGTQYDSIIQKFKQSGSIKKGMFSLHFANPSSESKMIIGGYDEQAVIDAGTKKTGPNDISKNKTDDGIFWMYINSPIYWQVYLYNFTVGGKLIGSEMVKRTITINSRAIQNYIPVTAYDQVMTEIKGKKQCSITPSDLWKCECTGIDDPSFPTMSLVMGSNSGKYVFDLENKDYLEKVQIWCIINLRPMPDPKAGVSERWILGSNFMRRYDSVYDLDNRKLGLIGPGMAYTEEDAKLQTSSSGMTTGIIGGVAGCMVLILIIVGIKFYNSRFGKKDLEEVAKFSTVIEEQGPPNIEPEDVVKLDEIKVDGLDGNDDQTKTPDRKRLDLMGQFDSAQSGKNLNEDSSPKQMDSAKAFNQDPSIQASVAYQHDKSHLKGVGSEMGDDDGNEGASDFD